MKESRPGRVGLALAGDASDTTVKGRSSSGSFTTMEGWRAMGDRMGRRGAGKDTKESASESDSVCDRPVYGYAEDDAAERISFNSEAGVMERWVLEAVIELAVRE